MRSIVFLPFLPLALLLSLLAAACSDDSQAPKVPPPPVDAADFMSAYTQTLCDVSARCSVVADYLQADCESHVRASFGEDVQAAIEAGKIVYDADAAGACLAGLAETPCLAEQPSDATLASCLSALKGTLAAGEPCVGTFECAEGICPAVTGDRCPTVCPSVVHRNETCSLLGGPDCNIREGLRCSFGRCVLPTEKGSACEDNFGCQSGLVCVTNICVPLRGDQQGCSRDSSCQPGLFCALGGDEGGRCEVRLDVGAACGGQDAEDTNAALRHVQCKDGLICALAELRADGTSVGGVCAEPRDIGGDCTVRPMGVQVFETGCKVGLVCNGGKCEKPPTTGAACVEGYTCLSVESTCDPMTVICTALKANGEACTIDPECKGGFCGSMGTCVDLATFCAP